MAALPCRLCGAGVPSRAVVLVTFAATLFALCAALPHPFPKLIEVNFQPTERRPCDSSHLIDSGAGKGPRPRGFNYGWVDANSGKIANAPKVVFWKNPLRTCVENSRVYMQPKHTKEALRAGGVWPKELDWVFALPNGRYRVSAIMGGGDVNSTYFLREKLTNTQIVSRRKAAEGGSYFSGSTEIQVRRGKIRLTAKGGGYNSKLSFVKIERVQKPKREKVSPGGDRGPCIPSPSQFVGKVISPLACDKVKVDLPFKLLFDGRQTGVRDSRGRATGLTAYLPSSRDRAHYARRYVVVQPPRGRLRMVGTPGSPEGTANRHKNLLGVGLSVPNNDIRLQASVKMPKFKASKAERFCLFVAVSDQEFAAICAERRESGDGYRIRAHYETTDNERDSAVKGRVDLLDDRMVSLRMNILASRDEIQCLYRVSNGAWKLLHTLSVDAFTLNKDAANTDATVGTRTYGGVAGFGRSRVGRLVPFYLTEFTADAIPFTVSTGSSSTAIDFSSWQVEGIEEPTSMVWAGGSLWVASANGYVYALTFNEDRTQLVNRRKLNPIGSRLLLGITLDPNYEQNKCLWLSHSSASRRAGDANSGTVTRACGSDLGDTKNVISGLPRAIANHATNNLSFNRGKLYLAVGGNTAGGTPNDIPDFPFGTRAEQPLSAAILEANVFADDFHGDCTPLQNPDEMDATGIADKEVPSCGVRVFASGVRNVFDCVWHSNGKLYCGDNGVGGRGSVPKRSDGYKPGDACDGIVRGDDKERLDPKVRDDALYLIEEGKYYGHPNPSRFECVMGGGNPTRGMDSVTQKLPVRFSSGASFDLNEYPVGTRPHSNYRKPLASLGANRSPNGIIEYKSNKFCGLLKGSLLMTWFSVAPQVHRVKLNGDGTRVVGDDTLRGTTLSTGGEALQQPIGIEQDHNGNLFVAEFGANAVRVFVPKYSGC